MSICVQGEQERQMAQITERVSRARYERTLTKRSGTSGQGFSDQALEEGDEVMEEKAQELQQKLKAVEKEVVC